MNLFSVFVVFIIIWWVILFMVLPIGVRGQAEENDVTLGSEPGAPVKSNMVWKAKVTTIAAVIVSIIVCSVIHFELISLEQIIGPIGEY